MTTKEIRDRLILERAEYNAAIKAVDEAGKKIEEIITSISDEDAAVLSKYGMDVSEIAEIDVERCKKDTAYLENCKQLVNALIEKLHCYLEEQFDV